MKEIILFFILLFQVNLFSQSWNYKSGGNAFDGKYKTSSIKGKGTDFPYNNPLLVINLFNEQSLNFYIDNSGYFQDLDKTEILLSLDTEKNIIYECDYFSKSNDSKTIFLNSFINKQSEKKFSTLNFIDKLKKANKLYVRIRDNYGKNDLIFSLKGSSKAIDFVIPKKYREEYLSYQKEIEEKAKAKLEKEIKINTRILTMINNSGVKDADEWNDLFKRIDKICDLYGIEKTELDTINFKIKDYDTSVILLNKKGNELKEIEDIQYVIPKFISKFREDKKKIIYNKIDYHLKKIDLNKFEKEKILGKINETTGYYGYSFYDIDSLSIDVNLKYKLSTLRLYNKNKTNISSENIVLTEYLEKKENEQKKIDDKLIKLGLTELEKFLVNYKFSEEEIKTLKKEFTTEEIKEIGIKKLDLLKFNFSLYCVDLSFISKNERIKYIPICDKKIRRKFKKRYEK